MNPQNSTSDLDVITMIDYSPTTSMYSDFHLTTDTQTNEGAAAMCELMPSIISNTGYACLVHLLA